MTAGLPDVRHRQHLDQQHLQTVDHAGHDDVPVRRAGRSTYVLYAGGCDDNTAPSAGQVSVPP